MTTKTIVIAAVSAFALLCLGIFIGAITAPTPRSAPQTEELEPAADTTLTPTPIAVPPLPTEPTGAPVANLIALRSMTDADQQTFLHKMTNVQLHDLQAVAVTTPAVLLAANAEAQRRGITQVTRGETDENGAAQTAEPAPAEIVPVPAPNLGDGYCSTCRRVARHVLPRVHVPHVHVLPHIRHHF